MRAGQILRDSSSNTSSEHNDTCDVLVINLYISSLFNNTAMMNKSVSAIRQREIDPSPAVLIQCYLTNVLIIHNASRLH